VLNKIPQHAVGKDEPCTLLRADLVAPGVEPVCWISSIEVS
jgi:hypothetical protein